MVQNDHQGRPGGSNYPSLRVRPMFRVQIDQNLSDFEAKISHKKVKTSPVLGKYGSFLGFLRTQMVQNDHQGGPGGSIEGPMYV